MAENNTAEHAKKTPPVIWRAAEFERHERTGAWYVSVVGVALVLVVIALIQHNFFFALFIMLAAGVLVLFSNRKPHIVEFRIDDEGVLVGSSRYHYEDIDFFWMRERPGRLDEIVIKRKAVLNPLLKITADTHTAKSARLKLLEKLPEMGEDQESLFDIFTDWLGF